MLHGSLWDPEDEVKENVGAYIDEVRSRTDGVVAQRILML